MHWSDRLAPLMLLAISVYVLGRAFGPPRPYLFGRRGAVWMIVILQLMYVVSPISERAERLLAGAAIVVLLTAEFVAARRRRRAVEPATSPAEAAAP